MGTLRYNQWKCEIPDQLLYRYNSRCDCCPKIQSVHITFGVTYSTFEPDKEQGELYNYSQYRCLSCVFDYTYPDIPSNHHQKEMLREFHRWLEKHKSTQVSKADLVHPNRLIRAETRRRFSL